jgi:hypothetical protein
MVRGRDWNGRGKRARGEVVGLRRMKDGANG